MTPAAVLITLVVTLLIVETLGDGISRLADRGRRARVRRIRRDRSLAIPVPPAPLALPPAPDPAPEPPAWMRLGPDTWGTPE